VIGKERRKYKGTTEYECYSTVEMSVEAALFWTKWNNSNRRSSPDGNGPLDRNDFTL